MSEVEKKVEEETEKGGELLFCGTSSWDTVGRKKIAGESNLVSPSRLRPLIGVDIRTVVSGCGNLFFHSSQIFTVTSAFIYCSEEKENDFCTPKFVFECLLGVIPSVYKDKFWSAYRREGHILECI